MKIIHIMKDGTTRDSIEGMVVSITDNREVYAILNELNKEVLRNEKQNH